MKFLSIPYPPDSLLRDEAPTTQKFHDVFGWIDKSKGLIENTVNENARATGAKWVVGAYTPTTTISGAMSASDTANALCTLVAQLQSKGTLS